MRKMNFYVYEIFHSRRVNKNTIPFKLGTLTCSKTTKHSFLTTRSLYATETEDKHKQQRVNL